MAHPDYSLMIRETIDPVTSIVTRNTYLFSNVNDARHAFKVEAGNPNTRVSLFEQPQPTKFHRDDTVPLPPSDIPVDTWD